MIRQAATRSRAWTTTVYRLGGLSPWRTCPYKRQPTAVAAVTTISATQKPKLAGRAGAGTGTVSGRRHEGQWQARPAASSGADIGAAQDGHGKVSMGESPGAGNCRPAP